MKSKVNMVGKRSVIKRIGVFVKDYGRYIQIINPMGLRVSIMKSDIIKVVIEKREDKR